MMPSIVGTVTEAKPRYIERRDGSGSFPLYEVWIDGQGPFVARKDVYNIAQMLMGFRVEAVTRSEQKGQFLNHYLDFVTQMGSGQQPSTPGGYMPNPAQQAQAHQPQPGGTYYPPTQPPAQPQPQPQTAAQVVQHAEQAP